MSAKQQMRPHWAGFLLGVVAMSLLGICKADSVQVFPEPWQVLEPGTPPEYRPKIEVLTQGTGGVVEVGDFIQISERYFFFDKNELGKERDWWLWMGFKSEAESSFFATNPAMRSSFLGLREGSTIRFLENRDGIIKAGELYINPLGDPRYYSWRKFKNDYGKISIPSVSGYSTVEIKRVCKGKAQYRTVRLFDDSWVQRCTWAPISCEMTKAPREAWMDEARIEAVCSDGKTATFQYGPIPSRNGKPWVGPVNPENYFIPWEKAAWEKLPVGVQLK